MLEQFFQNYFVVASRYVLVALIVYLVYYVLFKKRLAYRKIQLKFPENRDYLRELGFSILAIFFMAGVTIPFFFPPLKAYNQAMFDWSAAPVWYHILSFPLMMIIHDTYFYWMHRSLHHPKVFKVAHLVHHKSTNPSPWAAYAFHPIEAFFEALIGPIILLFLPVHIVLFGTFFLFQIVYNVYGHSGYELYPKNFNRHWFGKWINTSVHHNLHHKYFDNSYGLYFTFWDRMMGTMHPKYDETFTEVTSRKQDLRV